MSNIFRPKSPEKKRLEEELRRQRTPTLEEIEVEKGEAVPATPFVKDAFLGAEPESPDDAVVGSSDEDDYEEEESVVEKLKALARPLAPIAGVIVAVFMLFTFVFNTYVVDGLSMFPELDDKDRVVLWVSGKTVSRVFSSDYIPDRGNVIVFESPFAQNIDLVKRVVALPGERITIQDGVVTVYNDEFPNGFDPDSVHGVQLRAASGDVDTFVPEGHVFVIGDNREGAGSTDSRNGLGPIPADKIKGTVMLRFLPLSEFRLF